MAAADTGAVNTPPVYGITTLDNPFNPFDEFDKWYQWDERSGYCTCGLLDRILRSSSELSDADQQLAIDQAIDEIVKENVSGKHIKIMPGDTPLAARSQQQA